jgi:aryl-alcohol dehydrogenase-like predicted oxidoreductase
MEYRNFGNSTLKTSVIGFGTWELGGGYGAIVKEEAVAAIHRAMDLGVTLFDTAPAYGYGRAEEVLGKALGARRKDVIVVTKAGIGWTEEGKGVFDGSRKAIMLGLEGSLKRLGTDYIDLLVVHRPDVNAPLPEIAEGLQEARRSGMACYVGVSNFTDVQLKECMKAGPFVANQVGYNLFDRRMEETIDFCRANGIGVMAYGSLCYGLLTGTLTKDSFSSEDRDWRKGGTTFGQALFKGDNFIKNLKVVEQLKGVARSLGKSLPQLAVNWVLGNPGITVALTGCRRPSEIEENVGATGWSLSEDDMARLESIMKGAAGLSDRTWPYMRDH